MLLNIIITTVIIIPRLDNNHNTLETLPTIPMDTATQPMIQPKTSMLGQSIAKI
jgi:hypothetical protein